MVEHSYIHIPFCIRKCRYCSFVSGFDISLKNDYLKALKREIKEKYKKEKQKTIYLGGGTPSLLTPDDIYEIISLFDYEPDAEITLEANPETVELQKFKDFFNAGINRISLGVQTFENDILKIIGRNHDEYDIFRAVETIKKAGFENFGIDLIYGLPIQTRENFASDLRKAISLEPKHISTYGLKIEDNSFFAEHPPENLPDIDEQAELYEILCDFLNKNGFEHNEISNFSKPGYESRHNLAYWKNKNYYGFGLNASGYEGKTRYTNTSDFHEYIKNPGLTAFKTVLSKKEILEEEIFLGLRLKNGVDKKAINDKFGINFDEKYKKIIVKYEDTELITNNTEHFSLTEKGFLLANGIMSEFIEV